MKRYFMKVCSLVLIVALLSAFTIPAAAVEAKESDSEESSFSIEDGVIEETSVIFADGAPIYITRTTYDTNTSIWEITENNVTTTFSCFTDYDILLSNLTGGGSPSTPATRGRIDAYTYRYMTTQEYSYECTAGAQTASALIAALSIPLGALGIPVASISAIALSVASLVIGSVASPVDLRVEVVRDWYEVYYVDGTFMCYYCEYTIDTYVYLEVEDRWALATQETGDFDALQFG